MIKKCKILGFVIGLVAVISTCVPVYATTTFNSNTRAIYSASQLKRNFGSKTNPPKGTKTTSASLPASNGFIYADFAIFNSKASENNLGGTPIYILGTIKSVEKLASTGDIYYGAFLVDGCDGYQWCATMDVPKANFDLTKLMYTGKTAYIYGLFGGYSTDLSRPLLDIASIVVVNESTGTGIESSTTLTGVMSLTNGTQEVSIQNNISNVVTNNSSTSSETNLSDLYNGMVWVSSKNGTKYHTIQDCSGMKNPRYITLQEAGTKGYTPCDDCYNR